MTLEEYLKKVRNWDMMKNFPKATTEKVKIDFGEGEMLTFMHESTDYYQSYVYICDKDDDKQLLSILYKHIGKQHSFDELYAIMDTINKRD